MVAMMITFINFKKTLAKIVNKSTIKYKNQYVKITVRHNRNTVDEI